jgi:hypothetical protein
MVLGSTPVLPAATKRNPETEDAHCVEPARDLDIARRLYRAMCERYPDRQITLYDGSGRVLETTTFCEVLLGRLSSNSRDVCS